MADIYDNSPERKFVDGLKQNITSLGVKRVDFCIGYFNLRGWDQIANEVDTLEGEEVYERDEFQQDVRKNRFCRLLIGGGIRQPLICLIHKPPHKDMRLTSIPRRGISLIS